MASAAAVAALGASGTSPAAASSPAPRLVKAAHEFEAQMMKELLKPLNHASGLTGSDDGDGDDDSGSDSGSGSTGALGEFASEALGKALSEGGGFGIATSIVHQLAQAGHPSKATQVTKNQHIDTVMRVRK